MAKTVFATAFIRVIVDDRKPFGSRENPDIDALAADHPFHDVPSSWATVERNGNGEDAVMTVAASYDYAGANYREGHDWMLDWMEEFLPHLVVRQATTEITLDTGHTAIFKWRAKDKAMYSVFAEDPGAGAVMIDGRTVPPSFLKSLGDMLSMDLSDFDVEVMHASDLDKGDGTPQPGDIVTHTAHGMGTVVERDHGDATVQFIDNDLQTVVPASELIVRQSARS